MVRPPDLRVAQREDFGEARHLPLGGDAPTLTLSGALRLSRVKRN